MPASDAFAVAGDDEEGVPVACISRWSIGCVSMIDDTDTKDVASVSRLCDASVSAHKASATIKIKNKTVNTE
jgi:hypothetical protein